MLPQTAICTKEETASILDEYRLNEGQTLDSLSNSHDGAFMDSVCNFIKGMGYANRRDQALQEKKIKDHDEVKKKGQDRVGLEKVMRTEIPNRFYPTTVDYDRERWPEGLATMKSFLNLCKKGDLPNMYISGQSYCGKSHLVAYALYWLAIKGYDVFWVNVPNYFDIAYKKEFQSEVVRIQFKMQNCKILVLDDVFKRSFYETGTTQVSGAANTIYSVIERRLGKTSTIMIDENGLNSDVIQKGVSKAVINRIKDKGIILDK